MLFFFKGSSMKNRKVSNALLVWWPRADSIILSELAEWLWTLAWRVLRSSMCTCVGVGAITNGTQTALTWVNPTSHLGTELENRGLWQTLSHSARNNVSMWWCHVTRSVAPWLTGTPCLLWSILSVNTTLVYGPPLAAQKRHVARDRKPGSSGSAPSTKAKLSLRSCIIGGPQTLLPLNQRSL